MDRYPYIQTLLITQIERLKIKRILDIGAYLGGASIPLAKRFPGIEVHGVEPHPVNCRQLQEAAVNFPKYTVHELAIGNSRGTALLSFEQEGITQSAAIAITYHEKQKSATLSQIDVPTMSLRQFSDKIGQPDLIIINCEGSEFLIFDHKESRQVIKQTKCLDISLHGKSFQFLSESFAKRKKGINDFLLESGFRILFGEIVKDHERVPRGHIRQVWVK